MSDKLFYVLFADATNVFLNGKNINTLVATVQHELSQLYIWLRANKGVGIICRAKKYFNTSALINLYNAYVFPYLIYCVEVWGNALSTHIQPLLNYKVRLLELSRLLLTPLISYMKTQTYFNSQF